MTTRKHPALAIAAALRDELLSVRRCMQNVSTVHVRCGALLLAATQIALILGLFVGSAAGQTTTTTTFRVTSFVAARCSISATNLAFGTYSGTQLDATSQISVTCSNTTPYEVGLSGGLLGRVGNRQMTGLSTGFRGLQYSLSKDAARSENWGDGRGRDTVSGVGSGTAQSLTVYGRIGRNQSFNPGLYFDIITATITF
jgi:spore coat protein U-like protein